MQLRTDFSRFEVVRPQDYVWVQSPMRGVERMMLYRDGTERAIATSLVRYAPNAEFQAHVHPQGEEILVLEGIFAEGDAHYAAGSYLRSPPQSQHAPYSPCGALIFVKLRQMRASETEFVRLDTTQAELWQPDATGVQRCNLYQDAFEQVALVDYPAQARIIQTVDFCVELLLLSGSIINELNGEVCTAGTWLRLPAGYPAAFVVGTDGCKLYMNIKRAPVVFELHD